MPENICAQCGAPMTGPKYRDDGFRYYHVYECPQGHRYDELRPHSEWLDNQRAMRGLDARDQARLDHWESLQRHDYPTGDE